MTALHDCTVSAQGLEHAQVVQGTSVRLVTKCMQPCESQDQRGVELLWLLKHIQGQEFFMKSVAYHTASSGEFALVHRSVFVLSSS